ncbi:unnamed protein product [Urochloa humidicola]
MSSAKRRRGGPCHGTTAAAVTNLHPPFIPVDLLIEILARSDTKTILRGAATCKPIRCAILGPDFHGRVAPPRSGRRLRPRPPPRPFLLLQLRGRRVLPPA